MVVIVVLVDYYFICSLIFAFSFCSVPFRLFAAAVGFIVVWCGVMWCFFLILFASLFICLSLFVVVIVAFGCAIFVVCFCCCYCCIWLCDIRGVFLPMVRCGGAVVSMHCLASPSTEPTLLLVLAFSLHPPSHTRAHTHTHTHTCAWKHKHMHIQQQTHGT